MQRFSDIHTHRPGKPSSVLSISVTDVEQVLMSNEKLDTKQYYSLQLHPWHLAGPQDIETYVAMVRQLREDPYFVAIGECGLDALCSTPLSLQTDAFRAALQLADELHKPVIIHCVKLWSQLLTETKGHQGLMIIHGFRKGPELARQLLNAGFAISLGQHYHPEVRTMIPQDQLFFETDELSQIY